MRNSELDLPSLRFGLGRAFLLAANYFIGHQFVYPFLLSFVVLGLQPEAVEFPLWALIVLHTVTFVTTIWIALPLLKESLVGLRHNFTKTLLTPWVIFPLMYLTSIAVAMLTMWASGQAMPGNENAIRVPDVHPGVDDRLRPDRRGVGLPRRVLPLFQVQRLLLATHPPQFPFVRADPHQRRLDDGELRRTLVHPALWNVRGLPLCRV